MKVILLVASLILGGLSAHAQVTPAHLALSQVRNYFEQDIEQEILQAIPPHKARSFLIEMRTNLMRGKFGSERGDSADYFGNVYAMVQVGAGDNYLEVKCRLSARTKVVPFAKQLVPILEEEINSEQLLLTAHKITCQDLQ